MDGNFYIIYFHDGMMRKPLISFSFFYLFIYFFEVFKNFGIIVFNTNSRTMISHKKYFVFQLLRFSQNKLFNIFSLDFMSLWSLILATHHLKKAVSEGRRMLDCWRSLTFLRCTFLGHFLKVLAAWLKK